MNRIRSRNLLRFNGNWVYESSSITVIQSIRKNEVNHTKPLENHVHEAVMHNTTMYYVTMHDIPYKIHLSQALTASKDDEIEG